MVTTLTQSLGTFMLVSLVFEIVFQCIGVPVYLAFVFGGIALATAPAPALSIVSEFHSKGPVTDTLLPHSGVSLVFTAIICATLEGGGESELAVIVKGTIAAAAVINEIIAVIMAKKGFEKAGEI